MRDFGLGKRLALQQALFGHHLAFLVVLHLYLVKGNWSSHGLANALHQPVDPPPLVHGQPAARWRGLLRIFKKCTNSQGVVVDCGDCLVLLEELNPSKNTHTHTHTHKSYNQILYCWLMLVRLERKNNSAYFLILSWSVRKMREDW